MIDSSVGEPAVAERLALTDPVVSVADAFKQALGVDDLSSVSQTQIDAVAGHSEFAVVLDNLSGEADGEALVISSIRLRELDDPEGLEDAELLISDVRQGAVERTTRRSAPR